MVCLGPATEARLLDFNKIAHVRLFSEFCSGTEMGIWSEHSSCCHLRLINDASCPDLDARADLRIANDRVRANMAVRADSTAAQNLNERFNNRVRLNFRFGINHAGLRPVDAD